MGTISIAHPIDADVVAWLQQLKIAVPKGTSRAPTGAELKTALGALKNCSVTIHEHGPLAPWRTEVEQNDGTARAVMEMETYPGDDQPVSLSFNKSDQGLIERILRQLTPVCGPLVLVVASDGQPILIEP